MSRPLHQRSHRSIGRLRLSRRQQRRRLRPVSLQLSPEAPAQLHSVLRGLPELAGSSIFISVQPALTAHRGKLLSNELERGSPVHAASFIRARHIVLETALRSRPRSLKLIVVHEIFHFVWARLGNRLRREFTNLLARECECGARGALGESSAVKKSPVLSRDYVCESFCDTAAWLYSGVKRDPAFTLAKRWRRLRRAWFEETFAGCRSC